jgi:hypothetical protein
MLFKEGQAVNGFLFAVISVFSALVIWGCSGGGGGADSSTPEAAIMEFYSALKDGEVSRAVEGASVDSRERLQWIFEKLDDSSMQRLALAILTATKIYETDGLIVYRTSMINPDGQTVESTFELSKEDGIWRLSGI